MSSLLRKAENVAHPERREYYDAAAGNVADPSVPRTSAVAHGGAGPAGVGAHHAVAPEYTTTGHPHPHEHINSTQGKHGYIPYGRSPASGPAPTTAGPHRHDFMNKLDPRVDSTADHRPVVANTNAHHSKIANVLDPRVDSSVANDPNVGVVGGGGVTGGPRHAGVGVGGAAAGAVPPTAGTGYHSSPAGATHTGPTEFQLDPAVDSRTGAPTGGSTATNMGPNHATGLHGTHQPGMTRY
jgi:hypothetical protein